MYVCHICCSYLIQCSSCSVLKEESDIEIIEYVEHCYLYLHILFTYIVADLLLGKENSEYCCFSTIQLLSSCHVRACFQEKSKHMAVAGHHSNSPDLNDEDMIDPPKNTKYVVLFYYQKYICKLRLYL